MKQRPILFSADMVRAILAGKKTQTRRVVKLPDFGQSKTNGYDWTYRDKRALWNDISNAQLLTKCPYGVVGDQLWVREGFRQELNLGYDKDGNWPDAKGMFSYFYKADCSNPEGWGAGVWKSPLFMPRAASRILLEITNIRVERVQDISEHDAFAEGVEVCDFERGLCAEEEYSVLWTEIHGYDDQKGWNANPWVWVVEFKRVGGAA